VFPRRFRGFRVREATRCHARPARGLIPIAARYRAIARRARGVCRLFPLRCSLQRAFPNCAGSARATRPARLTYLYRVTDRSGVTGVTKDEIDDINAPRFRATSSSRGRFLPFADFYDESPLCSSVTWRVKRCDTLARCSRANFSLIKVARNELPATNPRATII